MIPIRDVFPFGSPNSPFGPVFSRGLPAGQSVIINDQNFPGLGRFLPCWAIVTAGFGTHTIRILGEPVGGGQSRVAGCVPIDGVSVESVAGAADITVLVVPIRASLHAIPMTGQSIYRDAQAIAATAAGQTVTEDTFPQLRRFQWMMALVTGSSTPWQFVTTTGSVTRPGAPLALPLDGSVRSSAAQTATVRRAMISHIMPRARVIGGEAGSLVGTWMTGPSVPPNATLVITEATVPGLVLPGWYLLTAATNDLVLEFTPDAGASWSTVMRVHEIVLMYLDAGVFRLRNTNTTTAVAPQFLRLFIT